MLKLTYTKTADEFQTVTVLGSPRGIADLYWQLTANYILTPDGDSIGKLKVTDLDGNDVLSTVIHDPSVCGTELDKNLNN